MNWYYESGGQQQGPVPEPELRRLLAAGTITGGTVVWKEGMATWRPLRDVLPDLLAPAPEASAAPVPPIVPPAVPPSINEPVPAGFVRCSLTGRVVPEAEAVYIGGRPYSAEAKVTVLQSLQQGGALPTAEAGLRNGPAWEQRGTLGWVKALMETTKAILTTPSATFATMQRTGGIGGPLLYYCILGVLFSLIAQAFMLVIPGPLGQAASEPVFPFLRGSATGFVIGFTVLIAPIILTLSALITSGLQHLGLKMVGAANQPFETTFRTYVYSQGAVALFMLVPVCGSFIAFFWGLVTNCIGLARTQEITTGKAVLGVLTPFFLGCVLGAIAVGIALMVGFSAPNME